LPSSWTPTSEATLDKATNKELEHTNYQPPQGILRPYIGGKKRCVDLEIRV
jgi:hypothetical protein